MTTFTAEISAPPLVDLPGRVQHEQAKLLYLHPRVGDHLLHQLLVGQRLALRAPGDGPLTEHVEDPLGRADGSHGMVDTATAEAHLGHGESPALGAEQAVCRHPHVVVANVGMAAMTLWFAVQPDLTDDLEAGSLGWNDERRQPPW